MQKNHAYFRWILVSVSCWSAVGLAGGTGFLNDPTSGRVTGPTGSAGATATTASRPTASTKDGLEIGTKVGIPESFTVSPTNDTGRFGDPSCPIYAGAGSLEVVSFEVPEKPGFVKVKYNAPEPSDDRFRYNQCSKDTEFDIQRSMLADYKKTYDRQVARAEKLEREINEIVEKGYQKGWGSNRVGHVMKASQLPQNTNFELVYKDVYWDSDKSWTPNRYSAHRGQKFQRDHFRGAEVVIEGFTSDPKMAVVKKTWSETRIEDAPPGGHFLVPVEALESAQPPSTMRRLGRLFGGE